MNANGTVKRGALLAYRGLSATAIVWLFATFASKDSVKSQWRAISQLQADVRAIRVDLAVETATSLHIRESVRAALTNTSVSLRESMKAAMQETNSTTERIKHEHH